MHVIGPVGNKVVFFSFFKCGSLSFSSFSEEFKNMLLPPSTIYFLCDWTHCPLKKCAYKKRFSACFFGTWTKCFYLKGSICKLLKEIHFLFLHVFFYWLGITISGRQWGIGGWTCYTVKGWGQKGWGRVSWHWANASWIQRHEKIWDDKEKAALHNQSETIGEDGWQSCFLDGTDYIYAKMEVRRGGIKRDWLVRW